MVKILSCGKGELGKMALPLRCGLETHAGDCGQTVQHHEPDVMPGFRILPPRIAQPDDEGEGHVENDGGELVDCD